MHSTGRRAVSLDLWQISERPLRHWSAINAPVDRAFFVCSLSSLVPRPHLAVPHSTVLARTRSDAL